MPWTVESPPPPAKNWTEAEKKKCVKAGNSVLADGGSEQDAIFACIRAAGKSTKNNQLHFITNSISTVKEITHDGRAYLVAPVVAIREGVMNSELVLTDEFGHYVEAWNGRPVSLGHPMSNGEPISVNSPDIWAMSVPGQLWNAHVDDDKLKAEIWIELEKAQKLGGDAAMVVNAMRANQPTEVSTGYYRDAEESPGVWNGMAYETIARNIRPDHLALLPNEIGACSWDDGCGVPRINSRKGNEMGVTTNEMTLDDRAMLVRRAFWEQVASQGDADYFDGDWDVLAVFDDTLIAKDWMSKGHVAFPYTLADEGGTVTFGESVPTEVVYRAKEGGAEIVVVNEDAPPSAKEIGLFARMGQWLKTGKTGSVAVQQQEEKDVKKCDLVTALVANKQVKFSKETLDKWSEEDLQTLQESLVANEEAEPAPVTPAAEEVVAPAAMQLPQEVTDFAKMIQGLGGIEKLGQALGSITANADSEKAELVADLVANQQCQFDEAELKAMSTAQLQKLAGSLQVRDYSGAAGVVRNSGDNKEHVMEMPKPVWAVAKEAN